jgi:hypothetical protein
VVAALLSCRLTLAAAQEHQIVEPEKSAVIATADTAFANIVAGKGTAISSPSKANPKKFDLVYKAPASSAGLEDVVTYTSGEKSGQVAVSISNAAQQGGLNDSQHYGASFKVLFGLFVLAVILESGLAVIFNWRPFLQVFDARGVKTIVSLLFALLIVWKFDLDIATQLINVLWDSRYEQSGVGMFVSALVLAGGSSGVNTLLVALGFRSLKSVESTTPNLPRRKPGSPSSCNAAWRSAPCTFNSYATADPRRSPEPFLVQRRRLPLHAFFYATQGDFPLPAATQLPLARHMPCCFRATTRADGRSRPKHLGPFQWRPAQSSTSS